jgi:hypothetical protein
VIAAAKSATVGDHEIRPERLVHARDHAHPPQRISTQVEEIVIGPDPVDAKHFRKQGCDEFFLRIARRHEAPAQRGLQVPRQRFPVGLSRRISRQCRDEHDRARHLVGGQMPQRELAQLLR